MGGIIKSCGGGVVKEKNGYEGWGSIVVSNMIIVAGNGLEGFTPYTTILRNLIQSNVP